MLIIFVSILVFRIIDPSGIINFITFQEGLLELLILLFIDICLLVSLLLLIWKLNMISKVKGFLQRDFRFKES